MSREKTLSSLFSFFTKDEENVGEFFLIAGLGNPGKQYENNRHNIGFMLLNRFANDLGESFSKFEKNALLVNTRVKQQKLLLIKPQTYMNRSGQPISSYIKYYKIPLERVMVVYDDVDLPFGSIRIRPGGGAGGHKGIASIIEKLRTNEFPRMRLGIDRPPGKKNAASYVLQDFSKSERDILEITLHDAKEALLVFIESGIETAMNRYNASE